MSRKRNGTTVKGRAQRRRPKGRKGAAGDDEAKRSKAALMALFACDTALTETALRAASVITHLVYSDQDYSDPSVIFLARLLRRSKRAIYDALNLLEQRGYVRRISGGGRKQRNRYLPAFDRGGEVFARYTAASAGKRDEQSANGTIRRTKRCKFSTETVQIGTRNGAKVIAPESYSRNPIRESYSKKAISADAGEEKRREEELFAKAGWDGAKAGIDRPDFEGFKSLWPNPGKDGKRLEGAYVNATKKQPAETKRLIHLGAIAWSVYSKNNPDDFVPYGGNWLKQKGWKTMLPAGMDELEEIERLLVEEDSSEEMVAYAINENRDLSDPVTRLLDTAQWPDDKDYVCRAVNAQLARGADIEEIVEGVRRIARRCKNNGEKLPLLGKVIAQARWKKKPDFADVVRNNLRGVKTEVEEDNDDTRRLADEVHCSSCRKYTSIAENCEHCGAEIEWATCSGCEERVPYNGGTCIRCNGIVMSDAEREEMERD